MSLLDKNGNSDINVLDHPFGKPVGTDAQHGDRHQPLLCTGRGADRVRIRPGRQSATLCHGGKWWHRITN